MASNKGTGKSVSVTIKSEEHARELIPAGMAEATVKAFSDSDNVHRRRADIVRRLVNTGLSHKGIVRAVTIVADGNVPAAFSDSNVSRYALAVDALADPAIVALVKGADAATVKADVNSLIGTLYTLASKRGGKANVSAAVAAWQDAETFTAASVRASAVLADVNAAARAAALKAPARQPAGITDVTGKDDATAPEPAAPAPVDAPATLVSRVSALADELTRLKADDVAPALADALADLAAVVESLVAADVLADVLGD